jgi:NAD(P)H-hydrate epimerase
VIEAINRRAGRVLAVDVPSGLDADTGEAPGACVRALHTATFVGPKLGFSRPGAREFTGGVSVLPIGVPTPWLERTLDALLANNGRI